MPRTTSLTIKAATTGLHCVPVNVPLEKNLHPGTCILQLPEGTHLPAQVVADGEQQMLTFVLPALAPGQQLEAQLIPGGETTAGTDGVVLHKTDEQVEVRIDDELFTVFNFIRGERKPYLYPVYGPQGVHMTRSYPMREVEGEPDDHPHHRGMWVSHGDVNGWDFWSEGDGAGTQRVDRVTVASGAVVGVLRAENTWLDTKAQPVVAETREYRFYRTPSELRMFDLVVTFTAAHGAVTFGDTKEGGLLACRVNPQLDGNGAGTLLNADNQLEEEQVWGKPAAWIDNYGSVDGVDVGVALFDTPGNLRYPTTWHARGYGLLGANPFGLSYFTHGEANGDHTLAEGESLTFRYRVVVHAGSPHTARIEQQYQDYIHPPVVDLD